MVLSELRKIVFNEDDTMVGYSLPRLDDLINRKDIQQFKQMAKFELAVDALAKVKVGACLVIGRSGDGYYVSKGVESQAKYIVVKFTAKKAVRRDVYDIVKFEENYRWYL